MTETVNRTLYLNVFMTERPKEAIDLLQTRLRSSLRLNDELADYFKERAAIEDLYAKNLAKLNKKLFVTEKSTLGGMLPAWERIQNELMDTSTIHATFASKMLDDIEKSLRSIIVADQAYAEIRSMDPTFQKLAKDFDDRQGKMIKQKKNLEKPGKRPSDAESKYADIKKQLDTTKSEWQEKRTHYIQLFQNVDEHRLLGIKNHLMQFETIQTDQMLKRVQLAGDNLASVSDISIENEIVSFCTQHATNDNMASSITASSESMNPPTVLEPIQTPSLLIDTSDDLVQPQSTKSTESYSSSHTTNHALSLPSVAEDIHDEQQYNGKAPSIKSNKKSDKQRKFLSTFSIRLKPKSSGNNQFGHQLSNIAEPITQQPSVKANSFIDNASTYSTQEDTSMDTPTPSSNTLQAPTLRKTSSFADSFFNQPSSPHNTPSILVDDEGFSIPPPDRSPWTTTTSPTTTLATFSTSDDQQDSNDIASMDSASLYGGSRIKLDIKADPVVEEDTKSSQVALTRVASMLKESNRSTIKRPRGRRELRSQGNSLSVPQPTSLEVPSLSPPQNDLIPTNEQQSNEDLLSPFTHDDDNLEEKAKDDGITSDRLEEEPAISARITEVIHAQLCQGQARRIMVTGEVALLYQGPKDDDGLFAQFLLKHDNGLETTFLADGIERLEETKDGIIYRLTPSKMDQDYMTCIKYRQIQADTSLPSLVVPLLVKPMWKTDGEKALLMIKYSKTNNASSRVTLDQVMMLTHVDGNCHSAQSLPSGQWIMDQQKMIWSLDDDDVQAQEQVIRAKFATTLEATPQPISVRFEMPGQLVSSLQLQAPHAMDGTWARINSVVKYTRSGKYIAQV